MTSLSIRLSNAIKLSPGKGEKVTIHSGEAETLTRVDGDHPAGSYYYQRLISWASTTFRPELVLVFLISLCVFFALLSFRGFDDNRLTSWQWIFAKADMPMVTIFLAAGLLSALIISTFRISHHQAVLALMFITILVSIINWGNPEVIIDAGRYFSQAKYLELYGIAYFFEQWGRGIMAWTDMPLVPFIYGIVFKIFGESSTSVQIINTIFFSGTVLATYSIGKNIWNPRIGLYGASMLLAIPYLHTQIPLLMVDVGAMFFLTLAILLYIKAITNTGYLLPAMAAVGIILAVLAKYSNCLMLSIIPIITCVYFRESKLSEQKQNILCQSAMVFIIFSLIAGIVLIWGYEVFAQQVALLIGYQLAALGGWSESHYSTFLFQIYPFVSLAALFSVYLAYRKRDYNFLIISWMLLLILILDIKRIRYILIAFPMIALMAGYALSYINHEKIRRYLILSILVSASTISVFGHASFLKGSSAVNLKQAGDYINSLELSSVEVITLEQSRSSVNPVVSVPLFDLYIQKPVYYWDAYPMETLKGKSYQLTSPLRFTWEYKLPEYYKKGSKSKNNIIAIVLGSEYQVLPDNVSKKLSGYYKEKSFNTQAKIFRYTTIVDIYLPIKMLHNTTI